MGERGVWTGRETSCGVLKSPGFTLLFPVALWPAGGLLGGTEPILLPVLQYLGPPGLLTPSPQDFLFPCQVRRSRASAFWLAAHILGIISTNSNAFKSQAEPPGQGTACRADSCEVVTGDKGERRQKPPAAPPISQSGLQATAPRSFQGETS